MTSRMLGRVSEVLLADGNPADTRLTVEAFKDGRSRARLRVVQDGEECMAYLHRRNEHADAHRPDLILLDLNLPKKTGLDVLREIKADKELKTIPVIVMTRSDAGEDVRNSYDLHANCYITKPEALSSYREFVSVIERFWLGCVHLPS